mgnify:CR=1 FL=1
MKKNIFILLLFSFSTLFSTEKFNLQLSKTPLREALQTITKLSQYSFIYGDDLVKNFSVQCTLENVSVEEALQKVLQNTPITYTIKNETKEVVLYQDPNVKTILSGIITEKKSGEVLIGTPVTLYNDTTSQKPFRWAITNKYGFYSIPDIPPGTYTLIVRSLGFITFQQEIILTTSEMRKDIALNENEVQMQEVVVEGMKENQPIRTLSTISVPTELVQHMPSLGGEKDVFRVLQLLPGVKSASELSSGLYVRGGSPDQNLVLLDGVIVYNPSHLGGFLSTFNADALRDIRLIKGGFPAEYGGRLSSVLDMTMKEGSKEKIHGAGGINLINSRLTLEGPITDNMSFMISGRRMYLDAIFGLAYLTGIMNKKQYDETPTYYFYDLNTKLNYTVSPSDRIYLSGYFGRDVLNTNGNTKFDLVWGNATGNLRWTHILSPTMFTNFSLIYTDYSFNSSLQRDTTKNNTFSSLSKIQDIMFRGETQYSAFNNHLIKIGTELTNHTFRAATSLDIFTQKELLNQSQKIQTLDGALYAQDEWNITEQLSTNIGGRMYYFQSGNYLALEPRFSASYALAEDLKVKGSYSIAHQFLHLIIRNDITLPTDLWFPSTKNIIPSKSQQWIVGIERNFGEEYIATVEGYYKTMENLYEYKDDAIFTFGIPLEEQFAKGTGEAYGIEIFFNKRIGSFTGWLGYTLAWTKRTFPELNLGRTFYARYDRRHDVSLVMIYKFGESWELGATWTYGTGQAYTMPSGQFQWGDVYSSYIFSDVIERNGYRVPSFHKLDLNFMYNGTFFGMESQLSINIYNAYNRANPFAVYVDTDYYSQANPPPKVLRKLTIFPIIPTFGWNFKF